MRLGNPLLTRPNFIHPLLLRMFLSEHIFTFDNYFHCKFVGQSGAGSEDAVLLAQIRQLAG